MVAIKPIYNKFIPKVIPWFIENYCPKEPVFNGDKVILNRILENYEKNFSDYQNGSKTFKIEKRYICYLKDAVYQAIYKKYIVDDMLNNFEIFLNEEYGKWRRQQECQNL